MLLLHILKNLYYVAGSQYKGKWNIKPKWKLNDNYYNIYFLITTLKLYNPDPITVIAYSHHGHVSVTCYYNFIYTNYGTSQTLLFLLLIMMLVSGVVFVQFLNNSFEKN